MANRTLTAMKGKIKEIIDCVEEKSEEISKSKCDFMSSDKPAEEPKSADYGFDYKITVEGEYYVFRDKSNSIKRMTPDDFHYYYQSKTKEEQSEDSYDERDGDEEFKYEEVEDYDISCWKINDEDQPKVIKTKFRDRDFIIQAMEETMLKRRCPWRGKGKESEDTSTLEELSSSDVQKCKSADANDDSVRGGDYALV